MEHSEEGLAHAVEAGRLPISVAVRIATGRSELAKVGIKMNIQNLASNAYIQDWLRGSSK